MNCLARNCINNDGEGMCLRWALIRMNEQGRCDEFYPKIRGLRAKVSGIIEDYRYPILNLDEIMSVPKPIETLISECRKYNDFNSQKGKLPRYMSCPLCANYHTAYPYCDTCVDGNRFIPSRN